MNDVDQIQFNTAPSQINYNVWWDAIGGNWDPNYNIGDNLQEGLLLSFENSTVLDWTGYSLDGQVNKTILGNSTIPMPIDGAHYIQVFGNDSLGTMYKSNINTFSAYQIEINTPEDKIITDPMTGYYPGTYGFENDILNSFPYGWIDEDVSTCETKVIGALYGHNNVVQQYDDHGSAAAQMSKNIPATSIITVEFWVRTDLLTFLYFNVRDSSITWNTWDLRNLSGFSVDTWHHVRFVINTITDKYDSYLDGVLKNNQTNLASPMNDVDHIQFNTAPTQINYNVWWDAIGGNWDTNYNIGDNLEEGLLLSFENSTVLDWTGYSLDGQVNKTILGNSTIPMSIDGAHYIQVFGNNSNGKTFKSELRHFEVDLKPPEITINIPNQDDLVGSIAPDFNISITELNLNKSWYTLDNGLINTTFTGFSGTIDQTEWDKLADGLVTIIFYANDAFGRENHTEVSVIKDTTIPVIMINSPTIDEFFGDIPPDYDILITDLNLESIWYTLDGGTTNITSAGITGTINQNEWDKFSDGTIIIRFYANNSIGGENHTEVTVNKDSTDPQITINSPGTGDTFIELPPTYDITVIDDNLGTEWYTIDGGVTNFTISGLTGYIDSTAWNNAPMGAVTIRFYSRDLAGNEVYQEVVVIKQSPSQPPSILGYDMVILISVLSFFSVLIINKISHK